MKGEQCQWPKKMMGRGADGGCGTEERSCRPFCRVSNKNRAKQIKDSEDSTSPEIDFLAQAGKALCERSPFDILADGSTSGLSVPTLPSGLAILLKHSDSRKRHKKSHSGADNKKKSSRQGERSRAGNIWVETVEYFRNIALLDVEVLSELSSFCSLATRKCFSIPSVGDKPIANGQRNTNGDASIVKSEDDVGPNGVAFKEEVKNVVKEGMNDAVVKEEEVKEEVELAMEADNMEAESLPQEENVCSVSDSSSSLEWVLGSRNRILLTSERPSKKRKLLGGDAGLDKLIVACLCEGNSSLCDFCCTGSTGKHPNQLIVCSSCETAVHQKCYGVHEDAGKSWLCSWCKQRNGRSDSGRPCALCPKQGGALKRVHRNLENGGPVEFAHLFCSLWMPEVYIDNLTKMEPILNLDEIKETRRKLVCNVCKVKSGASVRCSNGTCRTSFHPICAREAGHRLEVWGKYGSDTIELRAFCSKHSNVQESGRSIHEDRSSTVGDNSSPPQSLKEGRCNSNKMAVDIGTPGTNSDISGNSELREMESPNSKLEEPVLGSGEAQHMDSGTLGRNNFEEITLSESFSFALILQKLIDRGKVYVKDVAADMGTCPDALSAKLIDGNLMPDLQCKIVNWLRKHAYMGTWHRGSKVKAKPGTLPKTIAGPADCVEIMTVQKSDIPDPAAVFSVLHQIKNESQSSAENFGDNGILVNESKADQLTKEEQESTDMVSVRCASEKSLAEALEQQDFSGKCWPRHGGDHAKPLNWNLSNGVRLEDAACHEQSTMHDHGIPINVDFNSVLPDLLDRDAFLGSYVHPYIREELSQMQNGMFLRNSMCSDCKMTTSNFDGKEFHVTSHLFGQCVPIKHFAGSEGEISHLHASASASVCCNHQSEHKQCNDKHFQSDDQLSKARELSVLELFPEDEVEGELIYYQHQLLGNAISKKQLSDNLVCKVTKKLPLEIDAQRRQRWDDVIVNKYFYDLREARKQGRKEKWHKEAQAVLAAATTAAAASSRISSLRKETSEDCAHQNLLKTSISNGKAGGSSQLMPRAKEMLSKMAVSRAPSQKQSDYLQNLSEFSRENPRSCDICRRSETIWNLILVCSSCKVAVHLDCYRCVKESTGPWYCELCEELSSSRSSGAPCVNFWEKPYSAGECALCGGTAGAFRKATNGQWVHAFCAEWVLESTFRRGQVDPVLGVETVLKGINLCCVCRSKHGACIKCNYGNCQTIFHPSCARSAGFYMTGGGKLPHKAYCERHSLEQKAKADTQRHGSEELKIVKQYRVELERLRLLCERIAKREKIKRDLVLCSQEILAVKRDHAAHSLLVRRPFFPPDVSSESATASLKGNPDSNKSGSKTDDSVTSRSQFTHKSSDRAPFSGKSIPHRHCIVSHSVSDDGEKSSKTRKPIETFAKELVMTSDEASIKNRGLPKGYFYVPVDRLGEENPVKQNACSGELSRRDG